MTLLTKEVEEYVRAHINAAQARHGLDVADRVLPARKLREGSRPIGTVSDPTADAVTDTNTDRADLRAWRDAAVWALSTLEPMARDAVQAVWGGVMSRAKAARMCQVTEASVFVWEQQVLVRTAVRAGIAGLLGKVPA